MLANDLRSNAMRTAYIFLAHFLGPLLALCNEEYNEKYCEMYYKKCNKITVLKRKFTLGIAQIKNTQVICKLCPGGRYVNL